MRRFWENVLRGVIIIGGLAFLGLGCYALAQEAQREQWLLAEALRAAKEGRAAESKVYLAELENLRLERRERLKRLEKKV